MAFSSAELKILCASISTSCQEMIVGITNFKNNLQNRPAFIRPFVKRDFENGTGLEPEEWIEFLKRLFSRFTTILTTLNSIESGRGSKEDLREAALPFLERHELIIDTFKRFEDYMRSLPKRATSIPREFANEEDKRMMTEEAPKVAERLSQFIAAINKASFQLREITQ